MIEIKEAAQAAIDHLVQLYENPSGVRLEEVYRSDDDLNWLVTLSFVVKQDLEESSLLDVFQAAENPLGQKTRFTRTYKTFEVDGETGQVQSMKIRPVPSV